MPVRYSPILDMDTARDTEPKRHCTRCGVQTRTWILHPLCAGTQTQQGHQWRQGQPWWEPEAEILTMCPGVSELRGSPLLLLRWATQEWGEGLAQFCVVPWWEWLKRDPPTSDKSKHGNVWTLVFWVKWTSHKKSLLGRAWGLNLFEVPENSSFSSLTSRESAL